MTQLAKLEEIRKGWICLADGIEAIRGKDDEVAKTLNYCSHDIYLLIQEIKQNT